MNQNSLFTEEFFNYLNKEEEQVTTPEEKKELNEKIKSQIYSTSEIEVVYYKGQENNLEKLQNDPQYVQLKNQLYLISNCLQNFFNINEQFEVPSVSLVDFFSRITQPTSDHATLFYKEAGKKKLEEIAVLLNDDSLDKKQRIKIIQEFLASDGLSQCLDNCYLLISEVNARLKSLKSAKINAYHLLRNYITETATSLAAQRPFALPKSYQEILCDLNRVPILSHELHARNYFLMYAKAHHFPINVLNDVIAENMGAVFHDFGLQRDYIHDLEKTITVSNLITYLSEQYHDKFLKVAIDSTKSYLQIQDILRSDLDLLGIDDNFNWHEVLSFQEEKIVVKPEKAFRITITERLMQKKWIKRPVKWNDIEVFNTYYFYYYFPRSIELSWIEFFDKANKIVARFTFFDLLKSENIYVLSKRDQVILRQKIINDPMFISDLNNFNHLLSIEPSVISSIDEKKIEMLFHDNDDLIQFNYAISKIPYEIGSKILKNLPSLFVEQFLVEAFSKADTKKNFSFLPSHYFLEANEHVKQDILSITQSFIMNLIHHEYKNFSGFVFPKLLTINYLDEVNFYGCNLKYAQFYQDIANIFFDRATLQGAVFYGHLDRISFDHTDLRETKFAYQGPLSFSQISLEQAQLSTETFHSLLRCGIKDFISAKLQEVDFQSFINKKKLKINLSYVDLEKVNLSGLDLRECQFFNTNLKRANLQATLFRFKYINGFVQVEEAQLTTQTLEVFSKRGVTCFDGCEILADTIFNEELDAKLYLRRASFKKAKFIGCFYNVIFMQCDLTDTSFMPESSQPFATLSEVIYKKSKMLRTKFSSIKLTDTQISDSYLHNLVFENVKLPATTLFLLYQQGHTDFSGVRELKGNIPEKLPPFPLAGAQLSEPAFVDLYRQGLRDYRASNLKGFYLAGTLQKEAIPEIELKLAGARYKKFPLSCSRKGSLASKIGRSKNERIISKCIFYFFIQAKSTEESLFTLNDINQFAIKKTTNIGLNKPTVVIQAITLDHKPIWRLKNADEVNFYWQYQPNQDDLAKVISFTQKSIHPKRRDNVRILYYFTNTLKQEIFTESLQRNLFSSGLRHVYLGYFSNTGQPNVFYLENTEQDHILREIRDKLKSIPRRKVGYPLPQPPRTKILQEKSFRIAMHLRKVMLNGLRAGIRRGAHYDLSFALMHFLNAALLHFSRVTPQIVDEETKNALQAQVSVFVQREGDKREASNYQRELAEAIAMQCIDRGECFNDVLLHDDIVDTFNNLKPDLIQGNELLWKKLKSFFKESGKFLSLQFEKVKTLFQKINQPSISLKPEENTVSINWRPAPPLFSAAFLRKKHEDKPFFPALGAYMIDSSDRRIVIQNLTTTQSLLKSVASDYFSAYSGLTESSSFRKIYDWYDHPVLVEIIRRIEFVFVELGYNTEVDSPFSAEELSGLLYDLWLALDQCGITEKSPPEAIINLLKQVYFIRCVLEGGFLRGDCQCLEAKALQIESEEEEKVTLTRKKRASQSKLPSLATPTSFLNHDKTSFLVAKAQNKVSKKKVSRQNFSQFQLTDVPPSLEKLSRVIPVAHVPHLVRSPADFWMTKEEGDELAMHGKTAIDASPCVLAYGAHALLSSANSSSFYVTTSFNVTPFKLA